MRDLNARDYQDIAIRDLINAGLMTKTDQDRREDFEDVFDLDRDLLKGFRIQLDEAR